MTKSFHTNYHYLVPEIDWELSFNPQVERLNTEIRFFNHAFLKITGDDFSFSTDPWAIGPAFNTGWWLKHSTKNDWIDQLNNYGMTN